MDAPADAVEPAAGTPVEVCELTLSAGGTVLLESASASFAPGRVALVIGPSGAGKSLLLKIIAGLVRSDGPGVQVSGKVLIDGREVPLGGARPSVGVVFQNFALFDELSPLQNVRFAFAHRDNHKPHPGDERTPAQLLEELGVPTKTRTALLSGGQRQRLAIARTLAHRPDVVLYDEPTSGLDAATAEQVARLIERTHAAHPKTSIIVTHDYQALAPIADEIYLLDPATHSLEPVPREEWSNLRSLLHPPPGEERVADTRTRSASEGAALSQVASEETQPPASQSSSAASSFAPHPSRLLHWLLAILVGTSRVLEETVLFPARLVPLWKSPLWGLRYLAHYLRLVADPSAWLYLGLAGAIVGFVSTYFTFLHFPYARFTAPVLTDEVLKSLGFAMYRILVPVMATILIAARCGAAVASDVGGKVYGQQLDALRTFGVRPSRYVLTGICWAFLIGTPLLVGISFLVAKITSLIVFTSFEPAWGPYYWDQHFHRILREPGQAFYNGTGWLLLKVLLCAAGIAQIGYHRGASPKYSGRDVSAAITSTVLWSTLYVLAVHFALAFFEFD